MVMRQKYFACQWPRGYRRDDAFTIAAASKRRGGLLELSPTQRRELLATHANFAIYDVAIAGNEDIGRDRCRLSHIIVNA